MNYNMNPNLYEALVVLYKYHPFYYELLIFTTLTESKQIPTMGVRANKHFKFELIYNPEFVKSISIPQLIFALIHESKHLLCNHLSRIDNRNMMKSNIAQDMIINTDTVTGLASTQLEINKQIEPLEGIYYIPKKYDGKPIFELLYDWLDDPKNQTGKNQSDQDSKMIEDFKNAANNNYKLVDEHFMDEIPQEIKEQMVKDFIEKCRNRGLITSDVETTLGKLRKVKKNPLKELKKAVLGTIGNIKYDTWQKPNRKNLPFKGYKKIINKINVILDTSGSMNGEFEKVLSFLYKNDIEMNLIQCDTEVKDSKIINNSKQLNKIQIKGLGGTTLQPAIDLLVKQYNMYTTVILTDGYTDALNVDRLKHKIIILTIRECCPISGLKKPKQIKVEKDD